MPPASAPASTAFRPTALLAPLGVGAALLGLIALASSRGEPAAGAGLAVTLESIARGLPIALAWLAGAIGLGRLLQRLLFPLTPASAEHEAATLHRPIARSWSVATGLGVATMLFIAHLLGTLSAFSLGPGSLIAWAPVAVGLAALIIEAARSGYAPEKLGTVPWLTAAAMPPLALLITAAAAPPGTRWASEAYGYDVLSYHLQLIKEWLFLGRLAPLDHCVYSYLPSYAEGAYLHLAALLGADPRGFAEGDGGVIFAAQMLHAVIGVAACVQIGALAAALAPRDAPFNARRNTAAFAALCALSVPWAVVCASMAYTESFVLLLLAAGVRTLLDSHAPAWRIGLCCGLCLGAACAAKLTAAATGVIPLALAATLLVPVRRWPGIVLGTIAGVVLISAPWLIRNAMACGNPVFPWLTGVFGLGHWSAEQVTRFHSAHSEHAGLIARFGTLLGSERGMLHPQWSLFFPLVAVALIVCALNPRTRRAALLLGVMLLAQIVMWLSVGHLQSRFLMPLVVPGAALAGLAMLSLTVPRSPEPAAPQPRRIALARVVVIAPALLPLLLGAHAWLLNGRENPGPDGRGRPNAGLFTGVTILNGSALRVPLQTGALSLERTGGEPSLIEAHGPEVFINLFLPGDSTRILLLGDATPLYYAPPVLWHTTWDRSPLADAARDESTDEPIAARLARAARAAGCTHIVVNQAEIERLSRDGWYDPSITPQVTRSLIEAALRTQHGLKVAFAWPDRGQVLIALPDQTESAGSLAPAEPRP